MKTMDSEDLDRLLAAMIQSAEDISDLLFVAGKPPQAEVRGNLKPFPWNRPNPRLPAGTSRVWPGPSSAIIPG